MKNKKLAQVIRSARESRKLSLRDVDNTSGHTVSHPYLNQIELGQITEVNPSKLRAIAKALKLNYIELLIHAGHLTVRDLHTWRA